MKTCFMNETRACNEECMSYEDDKGKPSCTLMLAANAFVGAMVGLSRAQQPPVKHPASPPPPEVR